MYLTLAYGPVNDGEGRGYKTGCSGGGLFKVYPSRKRGVQTKLAMLKRGTQVFTSGNIRYVLKCVICRKNVGYV